MRLSSLIKKIEQSFYLFQLEPKGFYDSVTIAVKHPDFFEHDTPHCPFGFIYSMHSKKQDILIFYFPYFNDREKLKMIFESLGFEVVESISLSEAEEIYLLAYP